MPRPTKLTHDVHKALVRHVRGGARDRERYAAWGINWATARGWISYGRQASSIDPYATFAADIDRAKAAATADIMRKVVEAGWHAPTRAVAEVT
jgi:hypothetical protein